jgi:hypothetical protein
MLVIGHGREEVDAREVDAGETYRSEWRYS